MSGEDNLPLAQDGRVVKSSIDDGTGGTFEQFTGVKTKRNQSLLGGSRVLAPVGQTIRFFFAAGVGASGGNGPTKLLDELEGKIMLGVANTKGAGCGLETRVEPVTTGRDNGEGAGQKMSVEVNGLVA